jgi:hypothetical protein
VVALLSDLLSGIQLGNLIGIVAIAKTVQLTLLGLRRIRASVLDDSCREDPGSESGKQP